ncbi:ABC transporter ATP-binding protein [Paenibacillus tritici]|uniref:ABC transporter ATP-binding protein n=1 Tax=Paenibacillus tritici TaxID=1873425 RepID=UPI001BA687D5|nr:ABC transporter ATP-binding protein [Paenibacillus tritici]QUL57065.1 ABC transporter ATP-binding protein [Paenibacillus tritici]
MSSNRSTFKIYKWALSYLSSYKWRFILVVLLIVIASSIQLIIPKFVQYVIDDLMPTRQYELFFIFVGILVSLLIIATFFNGFQNNLKIKVQEEATRDLQLKVFQHTRNLGFSYFENHPVGETLSLLNSEVASMQKLYRDFLPKMLEWAVYAIIAGIIMFQININLTLSTLPCLLIYYIIGPFFVKKSAIYGKQLADDRVNLNQKINESISCLPEFKSNSAEDWGLQRLMQYQEKMGNSLIKFVFYDFARFAVRNFSFYLGFIVLVLYGYFLIQRNELTIGGISAFLIYYVETMKRITGVLSFITEQKMLMHQVERLYRFIHTKPKYQLLTSTTKHNQPIDGNIIFKDIAFRYTDTHTPVFTGLNFEVKSGEKVAIIGTSGNGKSTITKIIGGFYSPYEGAVLLDGVPLQNYDLVSLRDAMGFVFQETYLFGRTVRENILFGKPEATEEEVIQAAKLAYAHDFIMDLPEGYDTFVGERGIKLSGGQKQRISLARMFLKNPKIVILDEATSALDNMSEFEVIKALDILCAGRTTVMVAHRLSTIVNFDRILVLDQGSIVESGSHMELLSKKGIYYRIHNSIEVSYG